MLAGHLLLLWVLAVLHYFVPALLHLRHEHWCSECGRHHILHSAPVNNRPPAATRLLRLQDCFAKARLHATTANQEGRNLLEHSTLLAQCG